MTRDEIARMKLDRAERVRDDFVAQLKFQKLRHMQLTSRKARLIEQLDAQISEIAKKISEIETVISQIDDAHFNTLWDSTGEELQKIIDDPDLPF